MTEEEIHAAAGRDPAAKPWTASELRSARRVSRVKTLRKTMRLTQEELERPRFALAATTILADVSSGGQNSCRRAVPQRAPAFVKSPTAKVTFAERVDDMSIMSIRGVVLIASFVFATGTVAPARELLEAPAPTHTPCAIPTPTDVHVNFPERVILSPQSIANFQRFNADGYGSMVVIAHYDGSVRALIAPTHDIDIALHDALTAFALDIRTSPRVACGYNIGVFLIHFAVPSGSVRAALMQPPAHP